MARRIRDRLLKRQARLAVYSGSIGDPPWIIQGMMPEVQHALVLCPGGGSSRHDKLDVLCVRTRRAQRVILHVDGADTSVELELNEDGTTHQRQCYYCHLTTLPGVLLEINDVATGSVFVVFSFGLRHPLVTPWSVGDALCATAPRWYGGPPHLGGEVDSREAARIEDLVRRRYPRFVVERLNV